MAHPTTRLTWGEAFHLADIHPQTYPAIVQIKNDLSQRQSNVNGLLLLFTIMTIGAMICFCRSRMGGGIVLSAGTLFVGGITLNANSELAAKRRSLRTDDMTEGHPRLAALLEQMRHAASLQAATFRDQARALAVHLG